MTTELLETIEMATGDTPAASIIWMHGLGADGNDFVPLVHELELARAGPLRFVFPHAPMRPVTINNGFVMRAWYDVSFGDLEGGSRRADERGLRESQAQVERLIERELGRGIRAERIVLAGFSQGGAIALQAGLRHAARLAGIMALSTYLPLADSVAREAAAANGATPIFMAHGRFDPMVPYLSGVQSKAFLEGLGYKVEWHEYPMQHSLCAEEIRDIGDWLNRVLAQPAAAR